MKDPDKMSERELRGEVKAMRRQIAAPVRDYTIITSCRTDALVETVYEMIEDGWQPIGGICLSYERNIHRVIGENDINLPNDFQHYAQAMVKYEND